MKKFLSIMLVAFMAAAFTACKDKAESLVCQYEDLAQQYTQAMQNNDIATVVSLLPKAQEIAKEIEGMNEDDFTTEQQQRLLKATAQIGLSSF